MSNLALLLLMASGARIGFLHELDASDVFVLDRLFSERERGLVIKLNDRFADMDRYGVSDRIPLPIETLEYIGKRPVLPHERRFLKPDRYGGGGECDARKAVVHLPPPRSLGRREVRRR